ncbi:Hypothetical predicted protein [Paramuricea clavata]|uniref:Uncharacterized protein n=1 Tax=Paramuricea clavata TaxID=317549 RepID=A0A6S7GFA7_PARCT|nr:Hypothetical predicted protein [Paramuricea clavata]
MDRLRNKVLTYFEEKGCRFPKNSGKGASSFVSRLCDILFYVDGQYSKIEAVIYRENLIPAIFKQKFTSFNCPHQSKHKKRTLSNLSEKKLESYAIQMREIMQGQHYLDHVMPWTEIKKDSCQGFFGETDRYLLEEIGVAVQERRHGQQALSGKSYKFKRSS